MQLTGDELEVISRCLAIEARRQGDLQTLELNKRNANFEAANHHSNERRRILTLKEKIDAGATQTAATKTHG